jgi:hypothetical protein
MHDYNRFTIIGTSIFSWPRLFGLTLFGFRFGFSHFFRKKNFSIFCRKILFDFLSEKGFPVILEKKVLTSDKNNFGVFSEMKVSDLFSGKNVPIFYSEKKVSDIFRKKSFRSFFGK